MREFRWRAESLSGVKGVKVAWGGIIYQTMLPVGEERLKEAMQALAVSNEQELTTSTE